MRKVEHVRRYALTIAYDGTDFNGWQKQSADAGADNSATLRTVQAVVERAVVESVREPVEILGASRTDSGVHALAQVAAFSTSDERRGPPDERLALAINSRLPDDVLVTACAPAHPEFHPIRHCVAKGYRYSVFASPDRPLWNRRYVHHVYVPLDVDAMSAAAARLVGVHDFAAFAAAGHGRASTIRSVHECVVRRADDSTIVIDVSGDGFLYNMVRIVAGTLVEVGKGRMSPEDVAGALESRDRRATGPTLPPEGLRLEWIRYPGEAFRPDGPPPRVEPKPWQAALERAGQQEEPA
jgi:tRNA pseudouridine38-40 synthase